MRLLGKVYPPSPLDSGGATSPDIAANHRFLSGHPQRQGATRHPHGSPKARAVPTLARRTATAGETQNLRRWFSSLLVLALLANPATAHAKCSTRSCWHRVHRHRAQHWLKAHHPWVYAWRHLTDWERAWARCIANHETKGYPWRVKAQVNTGNGYFGSTQWLPETWHDAGGSGLPTEHSLDEQLVRTVRWAHMAGSSQWSTSRYCGAA